MRQTTLPEQTAKLIELGFTQPKMKLPFEVANDELGYAYSIGELIEMLPTVVDDFSLWIGRDERSNQWFVKYAPRSLKLAEELIDAIYGMAVKLKEEGVI